jgi:hypothetical protein
MLTTPTLNATSMVLISFEHWLTCQMRSITAIATNNPAADTRRKPLLHGNQMILQWKAAAVEIFLVQTRLYLHAISVPFAQRLH